MALILSGTCEVLECHGCGAMYLVGERPHRANPGAAERWKETHAACASANTYLEAAAPKMQADLEELIRDRMRKAVADAGGSLATEEEVAQHATADVVRAIMNALDLGLLPGRLHATRKHVDQLQARIVDLQQLLQADMLKLEDERRERAITEAAHVKASTAWSLARERVEALEAKLERETTAWAATLQREEALLAELAAARVALLAHCCAGCGLVLPDREAAAAHVTTCKDHPIGRQVLALEEQLASAREEIDRLRAGGLAALETLKGLAEGNSTDLTELEPPEQELAARITALLLVNADLQVRLDAANGHSPFSDADPPEGRRA